MPQYTWACHDCEIYWEREYNMGDAPEKTKCAECGKRRGRSYDTPTLKFIGPGFYVNDYGKNTVTHKNSKGACDEFVEEAKKSSEGRMKKGFRNYRVYTPDFDRLEQLGQVKKTRGNRDKVINHNAAKYREVATQLYQESGIVPEKQEKTNVDLMTVPDKEGLE